MWLTPSKSPGHRGLYQRPWLATLTCVVPHCCCENEVHPMWLPQESTPESFYLVSLGLPHHDLFLLLILIYILLLWSFITMSIKRLVPMNFSSESASLRVVWGWHSVFFVRLLSFRRMLLRFIHTPACISTSFLIVEWKCPIYIENFKFKMDSF